MPLKSWLPEGGQNLFQRIKAQRAAAEKAGIRILNLAIGQPQGPALLSARQGVAEAVMSEEEVMHEYQDNGLVGVPEFARQFVEFHTGSLAEADVAFLPIPGIKSALWLMPLACGGAEGSVTVFTTTDPGYPTPAVACRYLRVPHIALRLCPENKFRFDAENIICGAQGTNKLVMMNYPHNPSGQVATVDWLIRLCVYCEQNGIRLFNDAAYAALPHDGEIVTLAGVATTFPGLSWCEAFSASKLIRNGTGWRIAALVGSPDFIADIARVKGDADSGIPAFVAAGVLDAIRTDRAGIMACRGMYAWRTKLLADTLTECGMRLAVEPKAGFFTLWMAPDFAFGQHIPNATEFNRLMIENTGVVGVPFGPYIRYAVVGDVEAMAPDLAAAFRKANIAYNN